MITRIFYQIALGLLLSLYSLIAEEWDAIYQQLSSLTSPSTHDFLLLQNYLSNSDRDYLRWLDYSWYDPVRADGLRYDLRARNIRLFNEQGTIDQKLHKHVYHTHSKDKTR